MSATENKIDALHQNVTWDPVKEVFVGDEQANRLLSYARRPGWEV